MTWANQIRILKQQFEALGAIIGQNFIYALKPVVTALNTVMAKLIQFARVVSNSLGKIFGWKYEDTTGGIVDDLEYGSDYAEDLGSGLGGAANNAKKLKQQLQGFDELNVLTTNEPSSGGGGGGGVGGDSIASGNTGQWVKDSGLFDFESDLDSLYKLGDYIGTTLTNQLRSIDWQKVYQGAKNFGSGLASFLNGLISPELFSAVGATIAGALNTAIYTALSFGQTFDFKEFGLSIAEGINTFFRDTDFKALAQTINTWAHGILDVLITALGNVDWNEVGTAIGDFLSELDFVDLGIKLISVAKKIVSGLAKAFGESFDKAPLETAIVGMFALLKLTGIGGALSSAISNGLSKSGGLSIPKLTLAVTSLIISATTVTASYTSNGGANIKKDLVAGVAGFIGLKALGAGKYALPIVLGIEVGIEGFKVGNLLGEALAIEAGDWELADYYHDINILDYLIGDAKASASEWWGAVKQYIKNDIFEIREGSFIDNAIDLFSGISMDDLLEKRRTEYRKFWTKIGSETSAGTKKVVSILNALGVDTSEIFTQMSEDGQEIISNFKETGELDLSGFADNAKGYMDILKSGVIEKITSLRNGASTLFSSIKSNASNNFNGMNNNLITSTNSTVSGVTSGFNLLKNNISTLTNSASSSATQNFGSLKNNGINATDLLYNKVKSYYGDMKGTVSNETSSMASSATNNFNSLNSNANTSMISLFNIVRERMSATTGVVQGQNWSTPGQNLVQGLKDGISARWSQGGNSLISLIQQLASNLTSALKRALGIHSPSRLWRDEIGNQLSAGLGIGILDGEDSLVKSVVGMGNRLTNSFSGSLTLATPSSLSGNYDFGVTSTMAHSFSADTSMTTNIADGVRQGLSSSQAEQNALLREQNELLMRILDKTGISSSDLFSAVRRESRQHYNQTGTNAFVF